jgi:hypothetical protein
MALPPPLCIHCCVSKIQVGVKLSSHAECELFRQIYVLLIPAGHGPSEHAIWRVWQSCSQGTHSTRWGIDGKAQASCTRTAWLAAKYKDQALYPERH